MTKIIDISAGHAPDGGIGSGAVGLVKESTEARKITKAAVEFLNSNGVSSKDCTCTYNCSQNECLANIVSKHNSRNSDMAVSVHLNCADEKTANGIEILVCSTGGDQEKIEAAKRILAKFEKAGFKKRGIKVRTDLYFLNKTNAPAMLIEVFFCSSPKDCDLYAKYGSRELGRWIAEGLADIKITDVMYGSVVKVKKNVKIRSTSGSNYEQVGVLYAGAMVEVISTNKSGSRIKIGKNMWITSNRDYIEYE